MNLKKPVAALLGLMITMETAAPAFASSNEVTESLSGTGFSSVTLQVGDSGSGGGTNPDNPDNPDHSGGDNGDSILIATVPAELPIVMDLEGNITVPTNAIITNHVKDKGIHVSAIDVSLESGWAAADYADDFSSKAENRKALGLSFRGDTLGADGQFKTTAGNWNIAKNSTLPLNMGIKIPKQTVESKGKIATIGFTIDWSGLDGENGGSDPDAGKDNSGNGSDNAAALSVDWENGLLLPGASKVATYTWNSTNENDTIISIKSSNPDVADVAETSTLADLDGKLPVEVKAKARGTSMITAKLKSGATADFSVEVSELKPDSDVSGSVSDDAGLTEGDTLKPGDVTVTIPVTRPDGSTEDVVITPDNLPDKPLHSGDNEIEITVDVNGVTINITIHINVPSNNPSNGLTQSIAEAQAMGFTFATYQDGLQITKFENKQFKADLVIPEQIGDFKVLRIADYTFAGQTNLKSITFPDNLTSFGKQIFSGCTNLKTINIPSSMTAISAYALSNWPITEFEVPAGILTIEDHAFASCPNLTNITMSDSVTTIGANAFSSCRLLNNVSIPNSVTTISTNAFSNCTGLKTITIPDSVSNIGDNAFAGCTGLTSISIPATNLGTNILQGCTNINKLTLGKGIEGIKLDYNGTPDVLAYFFGKQSYSNVKTISFNNKIKSIPKDAFKKCADITTVIMPDNITTIGENAFDCCTGLSSVKFSKKITSIGNFAFFYCTNLTSITLPTNLLSLGNSAFSGCASLTSITFYNKLTTLNAKSFSGCYALKEVNLPDSLTNIGDSAFANCTSLTRVNIPNSVTSIGRSAFLDVPHIYYNGSATGSPWGAKATN